MNENFINTWVSNVELERTPNKETFIALRRQQGYMPFDKMHPLAQAIAKGWKKHSPSDSLVISTDLEVLGREPVNELIGSNMAQRYLTFLKEALDGKLPGFGEETSEPQSTDEEATHNSDTNLLEERLNLEDLNVVLTPRKREREILNVLRAAGPGHQDYTVINIDATAFENGGVLTIDITLGHAEASGSFDLFDGGSKLPTEGAPQNALASSYGIRPDGKGIIAYGFDRGQVFKLGATGDWFSKKGSVNAFWVKVSVEPEAKVSVEPDRKPELRKVSSAHLLDQSAEEVMNAFVKAFKNLDAETIRPMLIGDARETFEGDDAFEDMPEDMRTQFSQMMSQMKVLGSEYVGDEFHFRLRIPMSDPPEVSVKMRKVEGVWLIYDVE